MTVQDAIYEADRLKPNMYEQSDKIKWLSRLELRIKQEILDTHEDGIAVVADFSEEDDALEHELCVEEPHAELYVLWLLAQIDFYNMEIDHFNDSNAMFENVYSSFRSAYNQSHMPKGVRKRYF